jgi:hypothetical protein
MNWPEDFHDRLTDFLAGQGAAVDIGPKQLEQNNQGNITSAVFENNQQQGSDFFAPSRAADSQDLAVFASDWGGVGLLQTPTARFAKSGTGSVSISTTSPYTRLNVMLTPFDWLEAGFRYVDISNRLYGPSIAGSQSYKDKGIDAKFRLWPESQYLPQVALGLRDLGGTGLFAGEYLVASKRFGPIDASLGMGWGYVGGRGNLTNPLSMFSSRFKTRPTETASATSGGEFNTNTYFRGPAGLFGGLQYQTPWEGLTFKLELD